MNQPTMPHRHSTPDDWADRYRRDHVATPAPAPRPGVWQVPALFWAALATLSVVHVLRGNGTLGGLCG